jgi:CO/xanthine dehydrogenase FAD-binding subunit
MRNFAYLRPKSIDDAFSLMESYGERARYIAGDRDILVKIKEQKLFLDVLISLRHIPKLAYMRYQKAKGILRIGSITIHRMREKSPLIGQRYPILSDAVNTIGSVQIRNVTTIRGDIVNAVPDVINRYGHITLAEGELRGGKGGVNLNSSTGWRN